MTNPSKLKIYKASAGSGKTFLLAAEYLRICLFSPGNHPYRHILAITFTRKSTAEMKLRILKELRLLAENEPSQQLPSLLKEGKPEEWIRERARVIYFNILHDYSRFHIQTVDSFLQGLVRAFAREVGLSSGYRVELDEQKVFQEVIDNMLTEVGVDPAFSNWMENYVMSLSEEGKSWKVKDALLSFFQSTRKERVLEKEMEVVESLADTEYTQRFLNELREISRAYTDRLRELAGELKAWITRNGIVEEDLKYKKTSGIFSLLGALEKNKLDFGARVQALGNSDIDVEELISKDPQNDRNALLVALRTHGIPLCRKILETVETQGPRAALAENIARNFYQFGILGTFLKKLKEYRDDKELMLISDTSAFLQKIVGENQESFIFEKAGNRFHHFMIDEFQDTSGMQWKNLKPLILNALSEGYDSLLVGDVKQAIYRFRSGDWNLLMREVENDPQIFNSEVFSLDKNWRSLPEIIDFNNRMFGVLPAIFQDKFYAEMDHPNPSENGWGQIFPLSYEKHEQSPGKPDTGGYIHMKGILPDGKKNEDFMEAALEFTRDAIHDVLSRGYQLSDICILTRKRSESALVANYLLEQQEGFQVLSDHSLLLQNMASVRILTAALRSVVARNKELEWGTLAHELAFPQGSRTKILEEDTRAQLDLFKSRQEEWQRLNLPDLIETWIRLFHLHRMPSQWTALQAFREVVFNYTREFEASVTGFLTHWETVREAQSVDAGKDILAIRIMTINKSKGLQFPVVMLPFLSFRNLIEGAREILWAEHVAEGFPLLPVEYGKKLAHTVLEDAYQEETASLLLDKLNLLYVGFTRAERELYGCMRLRGGDSDSEVGALVQKALTQVYGPSPEAGWILGAPTHPVQEKEDEIVYLDMPDLLSSDFREKVVIKSLSDDLWVEEDAGSPLRFGRIMHDVLASIRSLNDWNAAVAQLEVQGKLKPSDWAGFQLEMEGLRNLPQVQQWFHPDYPCLNERAILFPDGKFRIPDRVVLPAEKTAWIIEFKTGVPKPAHTKQVEVYLQAYREMGFQTEGFILYTDSLEIHPV